MHQLEERRLRALHAQLLDDAEAHPAAAMHRQTGRLVEDQQRLVLEDDVGSGLPTGTGAAWVGSARRIGGMRSSSPSCRR
jgi:hypothetical protein